MKKAICSCGHVSQQHRYDVEGLTRPCRLCECTDYQTRETANDDEALQKKQ